MRLFERTAGCDARLLRVNLLADSSNVDAAGAYP